MTAFSDHPPPPSHDLHPFAEQIHEYLRSYSDAFGVTDRIRFNTRVGDSQPAWREDGEPVVVYGNGVSGHEIASDIATVTSVVSAYRKPRYVLQKNVVGVSSDWQWYTHIGALRCAAMSPSSYGALLRERVLRVAGNPADFGAREPSADFFVAGHSPCQDYLGKVRAGTIVCRPAIVEARGDQVTFADGSCERVDALVCATGYRLDIPYLSRQLWSVIGPDLRPHQRTMHPDLPYFGVVGRFTLQGPYFPLLERRPAGSSARGQVMVLSWTMGQPEQALPRLRRRSTRTTSSPLRWPRREWRRTCGPALPSPSRCCSVRCCRLAIAWTGPAPTPTRRRPSVTSWPPPRARRWSPTTLQHSPTSGTATCSP